MAAALTLAATTQEQQIFEAAHKLRKDIADYVAANPTADLQGLACTVTLNAATPSVSIAIVMPLTASEDTDGGISFDATEVMV